MQKDKRYNTVSKLMGSNHIISFEEVLEIVPKTVIAKDLRMHHHTFEKLVKDPGRFTFKNVFRMASLMEVDRWQLAKIIFNDSTKETKGRAQKRQHVNP